MRLIGEDSMENEDEEEQRRQEQRQQQYKLVVGYALKSKKVKSFLQPKLEGLARTVPMTCDDLQRFGRSSSLMPPESLSFLPRTSTRETASRIRIRFISGCEFNSFWILNDSNVCISIKCAPRGRKKGILFKAIDWKKSLSDQGPFDIVLHKLSGKEWCHILELYRNQHPEVIVLDPPDAVRHVHNRQSMLQDVADLNLSNSLGKIGVPKQLVVARDPSSIPDAVVKAGLSLPLVAKPLVSDGSAKSHQLCLAYSLLSLSKLEPPLVLQEFVNHGGVLFKVFIVGDAIKVVRRFSLPDVDKCEPPNDGIFRFPRVSCATASADEADLDPGVAEHPPKPLLEILAKELHRRLGLQLFNIDIIREHGTKDQFYVIDINYFPGYGKMPEYEHVFTDFLLRICPKK